MMARDYNFYPGTCVIGKWHRHQYSLIKKIGSGALGTVFLANDGKRIVAVKLAKDRTSLISEVHVLKQFEKLQGEFLGPCLYDNDDWLCGGETIGFSVMEYLQGVPANEALKKRSFDWTVVFLIQLLRQLQVLHDSGYIFADLKPENLIIVDPGHRIRCVDFGGSTRIGRSVREFTEFYDRGYWGMGSRKAEPRYDLFACAMIMIFSAAGGRLKRSDQPREQLLRKVRTLPQLLPYREVITSALSGQFTTARQMQRALIRTTMEKESYTPITRRKRVRPVPAVSEANEWAGAWIAASVMIALYVICVIANTI